MDSLRHVHGETVVTAAIFVQPHYHGEDLCGNEEIVQSVLTSIYEQLHRSTSEDLDNATAKILADSGSVTNDDKADYSKLDCMLFSKR